MRRPTDEPFLKYVTLLRERVPSFDEYPFSIPAVRHFETLDLHPKVTYFVGENGTGKSTLLEAIAVTQGFNPEGGGRNIQFSTRASHSPLCDYLRVGRGARRLKKADGYFLRAESFYNLATALERLGGPSALHEQSRGESFFSLVFERFGGNGLYLFDEPESALSPVRQMGLLAYMHDLIEQGSQFLIATHSPLVLAYPDAMIYRFSPDGIAKVAYEETESYTVTKAFLDHKEPMLAELLRPEKDDNSTR